MVTKQNSLIIHEYLAQVNMVIFNGQYGNI